LDAANGLLLCANIDALFDRCLISFSDEGAMLVSDQIEEDERKRLNLPPDAKLRVSLDEKQKKFMSHHRDRAGLR
jgi:predicted restriction endonuclease